MYFRNSQARRLLPMPAWPMIETRRARCSRDGRVEQVLEQAQLVVAADERRLEPVVAAAAAALGDDPQRPPRRDRRCLALEDRARRPPRTRSRRTAARWVASPTSTVPGGATDWSRDAVLTRSPATIPWSVAPRVTAASPVRTPARAWRPGPEVADGVDELERGPHARARRRPRGPTGAPQTAMTASPMNFSTVPP